MSDASDREEIARRYGFGSYAALLDISEQLPLMPGDSVRSYLARHPDGRWFVWEDPTQLPPSEPDEA